MSDFSGDLYLRADPRRQLILTAWWNMDNYNYWVHTPSKRVYAVWCRNGEVYGATRVELPAPQILTANYYVPNMTLGCAEWVREEIQDFAPYEEEVSK